MIRYSKTPVPFGYSDVHKFMIDLCNQLYSKEPIEIELQPGDATRYHFIIFYTFNDKNLVIIDMNNDISYLINGNTKPRDLCGNIWTTSLICEIYHRLFIDGSNKYYDFTKSCPIVDGVAVR